VWLSPSRAIVERAAHRRGRHARDVREVKACNATILGFIEEIV
jgi:hypothetical protein